MAKDYLADKATKKKKGNKALWFLMVLIVLVVAMVVKIILTGNLKPDSFSGLPSSDDAYTIAKGFVKPTLKSPTADFHDSHYQFGKLSDSVYVIQSSVDSRDASGEKISVGFKVTLKYNGGQADRESNWTLINLSQD